MNNIEVQKGKQGERGCIKNFETIEIKQLADKCNDYQMQSKYVFIADMSGQAKIFFQYQNVWSLYEWHAQVKKCIIYKTQKPHQASEHAR